MSQEPKRKSKERKKKKQKGKKDRIEGDWEGGMQEGKPTK